MPAHPTPRRRKPGFAVALSLLALVFTAGAADATAATAVSSNWSGYAVTGTSFSEVSGRWVQPAASCRSSTAGATASAFWVGLGGDSESSKGLEQTGTEVDCLPDGTVRYWAWYELVPKASVRVDLKVSAGDAISASVEVSGTSVTLRLSDLSTEKTSAETVRMSAPDLSSAEWVAEAPSVATPGGTNVLPLTDFGTVRFSDATARSGSGHLGAISDPDWSASRIELDPAAGPGGNGRPFSSFAAYGLVASEAVPSVLGSAGEGFSVTVREQTTGATRPLRA